MNENEKTLGDFLLENVEEFIPVHVLNIVVTVLIVFFVTLAMGQVILFKLNRETKENLLFHKVIACLGIGGAFYALVIAKLHFSYAGWLGLVGTVIGIVLVGSIIQKIGQGPPAKIKIKEKNVVSWIPDQNLSWCLKCQEHTKLMKNGGCANCRGAVYSVLVPKGTRQASYGCSGCAAIPVVISACALLASWGPGNGLMIALLMATCFVPIICFPIFFVYQYWRWRKWARQRAMYPHVTSPAEEESEER